MIERFDNAIQIAVLSICVIVAIYRAVRYRSRSWMLLFFFYGCCLLGDIYWLVCFLFYGQTPQISVVADLSWYAAYIFLYLLLRHTSPPEKIPGTKLVAWLGPVFALGMAAFFMLRGEIISNLIYAGLIGLLLFAAIRRLSDKREPGHSSFLPAMILVFCLLEYSLWTASCFWDETVPLHPYYVFDLLLTVSFLFFIPAAKKAVAA